MTYTTAPNQGTNAGPRSATFQVAGINFTLAQAGCSYPVTPAPAANPPSGGTSYTVTVGASASCAWTAVSNASWLTVTSGASGSGTATVGYTVAANNTGISRTATLAIGGVGYTITQASAGGGTNTQFVKRMYLDFLGRPADAAGLAYWTGQIDSGAQTRAQVAIFFFNSVEFKDTGLYITNAYTAVLNRDPDYPGWLFWFTQVRNGQAKIGIVNSFIASPEFVQTYGSLNNTQFVQLVYQNVLGRPADAAGLAYWVGRLAAGETRAQMMNDFMTSAEYAARVRTRQLSNLCYLGFLARTPEAAGRMFWTGALDGGLSEADLVNNFISSVEYQLRLAATP